MNLGNIKAAVALVRTIREDWPLRSVEGQVTELADSYPHPDVVYVCVAIAENRNNLHAATLTLKAPRILEELHTRTATVRTRTGGNGGDKSYLCDVCSKPQRDCQTDATNLNGEDHAFISAATRNEDRDQMHTDGRIAAARANALSKAAGGLFALPADVTSPTHPEPQQEEEAS
jgi:hypothetical protein